MLLGASQAGHGPHRSRAKAEGQPTGGEPLVGDMAETGLSPAGFDLVWSEGVLYNIGIENALGVCRGLLPVLALAPAPDLPWIVALAPCALFLDVALLTWRARSKDAPASGAAIRLAAQVPALQLLTLATQLPNGSFAYLGILPLVFRDHVCRSPASSHALVSALLASLPLLDWVFLFPAAWQAASSMPALAVACLCFPPIAFFAGQVMQRWVTAT